MIDVCREPIFIVGSPRSGTTILAKSLARHGDLWTSDESAHLFHLFGGSRTSQILDRGRSQPSPSWLATEEVGNEEFLRYLGLGLNALYTSRSGGKRWIEQTPLNTLMIEDLASMFPDAVFLHMVRDGRRVVQSMLHFLDNWSEDRREAMSKHIGAWTVDFTKACETWCEYVDRAAAFAAENPDRCLTVRNERLAEDPESGFARILDFLKLPAEPGPATHFRRQRVNSSFRDGGQPEPWRRWDVERRREFAEIAGPTMARAGFELGDDFLAASAAAAC